MVLEAVSFLQAVGENPQSGGSRMADQTVAQYDITQSVLILTCENPV